ncbi:MAG: N-formylglutamate deformylase [Alphaproteobacteria bacterium]|nr:N-formylglutamate deformylase [Alphaproteobacteria bacterium]
MTVFDFTSGDVPVLISIPHDGREILEPVAARMTEIGRANIDADWHVRALYDFAQELGASVLAARMSRYVVDLNRDPMDTALYPGAVNTGIVPHLSFDGEPLYVPGAEPGESVHAERIKRYWQPYHDKITETLDALTARFGGAVLYDAHSIRSEVPRLFDGTLPDFNLGTSGGASASKELETKVHDALAAAPGYTTVLNGRFKGGYITRTYGRPADNRHAVQLELSQRTFMDEGPPFDLLPDLAARVKPVLRDAVAAACDWARARFAG